MLQFPAVRTIGVTISLPPIHHQPLDSFHLHTLDKERNQEDCTKSSGAIEDFTFYPLSSFSYFHFFRIIRLLFNYIYVRQNNQTLTLSISIPTSQPQDGFLGST